MPFLSYWPEWRIRTKYPFIDKYKTYNLVRFGFISKHKTYFQVNMSLGQSESCFIFWLTKYIKFVLQNFLKLYQNINGQYALAIGRMYSSLTRDCFTQSPKATLLIVTFIFFTYTVRNALAFC